VRKILSILKHANKMINMNEERSTGIDKPTRLTPLDASPSDFNWTAIQFGTDLDWNQKD
jgi:hypothetical protein